MLAAALQLHDQGSGDEDDECCQARAAAARTFGAAEKDGLDKPEQVELSGW